MMIHDVIASLRRTDFDLRHSIDELRMCVSLMEVYLSQVSDYPAPPVSRETKQLLEEVEADGQDTLF